jgi:hypothetical protein
MKPILSQNLERKNRKNIFIKQYHKLVKVKYYKTKKS